MILGEVVPVRYCSQIFIANIVHKSQMSRDSKTRESFYVK